MSTEDLFAIDVAREVTTLAEAQLGGSWQVPAELVRFALRCGAPAVEVRSRFHRFRIGWEDAAVDGGVLIDLGTALDDDADPADRQRAIAALESAGAEALLIAGALPGSRLRIDSGRGEQSIRFDRRQGGRPRVREWLRVEPSRRQEISWSCAGLDAGRASVWLEMACRFAEVDVELDGRPPLRGFAAGLYHLRASEPVPCRIGLTEQGEHPVLWLLRDGVVSTRAALHAYPPFEAAVELGGCVPPVASSSDLRRAVRPFVEQLADRAVWMMVRLHGRFETMAPSARQRLSVLLLRSAKLGFEASEIMELPLIATLAGEKPLLTLSEIGELGRKQGGRIHAVAPDASVDDILADRGRTLVGSAEVRRLIAELAGVRLASPPRRRDSRWRRLRDVVSDRARSIWHGLRGGRTVADRDLIESERRLLAMIRRALAPESVALGPGSGRPRRTAAGWIIPRRHPALAVGARAIADEPAWLYPLVLALDLGEQAPAELRQSWLEFTEAG